MRGWSGQSRLGEDSWGWPGFSWASLGPLKGEIERRQRSEEELTNNMQVRDLSNHAGFNVLLDQAFHSEKDGELGHGAETGGADLHWVGLNPECRAQS